MDEVWLKLLLCKLKALSLKKKKEESRGLWPMAPYTWADHHRVGSYSRGDSLPHANRKQGEGDRKRPG
jgi:hypothetical protein